MSPNLIQSCPLSRSKQPNPRRQLLLRRYKIDQNTMHFPTSLLLALLPAVALAAPKPILHARTTPSLYPRSFTPDTLARRQSCVDTCGSTCYWQEDIDAAVQKGFSLHQSGDTLGDNDYPHEFDDREGFDISVSGPWYEFPILSSYEVYSGGSPGADRVVFNDVSTFVQCISHFFSFSLSCHGVGGGGGDQNKSCGFSQKWTTNQHTMRNDRREHSPWLSHILVQVVITLSSVKGTNLELDVVVDWCVI